MAATHSLDAGNFPHTLAKNSPPFNDDAERKISHFIPSLELTGSVAEKLDTLDTLIGYLQTLRRNLTGDASAVTPYEGRSRYATTPAWPWFAAGVVIGALFVVMLLLAHSWS